jgi:hypothetical protein
LDGEAISSGCRRNEIPATFMANFRKMSLLPKNTVIHKPTPKGQVRAFDLHSVENVFMFNDWNLYLDSQIDTFKKAVGVVEDYEEDNCSYYTSEYSDDEYEEIDNSFPHITLDITRLFGSNMWLDLLSVVKKFQNDFSFKLNHSIRTIEESIERYGVNGLSLSFNGGKDCTVLLHLLYAIIHKCELPKKIPIKALYVQPDDPFEEVEEFVYESVERYELDLETIRDGMKVALGKFLQNNPKTKAILIGTRKTDPHGGTILTYFNK